VKLRGSVVLCLLIPVTASAYERSRVPGTGTDGPCLHWTTREVPFVIHEAGTEDAGRLSSINAVRSSFRSWGQPTCTDFFFRDDGVTARTAVGYVQGGQDNVNLVIWREKNCAAVAPSDDPCHRTGGCNNKYNCWEQSNETIAVTTTTFSNRTGEIFDADVELNGEGFVFSAVPSPACPRTAPVPVPANCVATDIQNTMTHEIGHMLGLDHTDNVEATMYRSAEFAETKKRTLDQDDIEGLCVIYPKGAATSTCGAEDEDEKPGCGGCSAASSVPALFPLLLLAALRRRRGGRR